MAAAIDPRRVNQGSKPRGAAAILPPHQQHKIGLESDGSRRSPILGNTLEEQEAALKPPPERFQNDVKRHVARQPPVSSGYEPPTSGQDHQVIMAFNGAVGQAATALAGIAKLLKGGAYGKAVSSMITIGAGLKALEGIAHAAQVASITTSIISMADAFDRQDYQAGFDLLASVLATSTMAYLLKEHPKALAALTLLEVTYGSTWPTRLAHHLAGTHDEKPIEGGPYLHQPA